MKRKRNSLKSSQQQQSLSSIITRSKSKSLHATATKFYLPDECWESIFKFIINNRRDFKSLSLVSRQFLSITNRLPFPLTIRKQTCPIFPRPRLFHRFTNLTSLNFTCYYYYGDLNKLLCEISRFPLKLTSLNLSNKYTFPANGLRTFSQKITTLTSLICSKIVSLHNSDMFLIANCFSNLKMLDLSHCRNISEVGICHVLRKCCKIRHLDLTFCLKVKLVGLNFEVCKLEVLNLSYTSVDDEALFVISKSCRGLVQLLVKGCYDVTKKGVKNVVENCTQLSEINLRHCSPMHPIVVASMIHSSPSLRKIIAPGRYDFSFKERELFSRQGRRVC